MAKPKKDTATSTKKPAKPLDPVKSRNLVRLINSLALILAIAAFLLQLFAVLTHHWKWQKTDLHSVITPTHQYPQPNVHDDSHIYQHYGLYSRQVKLYANNDEQLNLWTSTRFPRPDEGDDHLHHCLSRTTTLRGAYLTCSKNVVAPNECHCRRYRYWNFVIFFEIFALILLGLALILTALITTYLHGVLKPAAAGVSLLAFLLLLIGLILILSHLKRETHTLADAYPHVYQRFANKVGVVHDPHRAGQRHPSVLHQAVRRQAHEHYRAYPLSPNQHPYNDTHFQEFSQENNAWVYRPYSSIPVAAQHAPYEQRDRSGGAVATTKHIPASGPLRSAYGPVIGYDTVFDHTRAGIGWSTVLSILAMLLALLLPLLLIFSWLTTKKLGPDPKTTTTTKTTVETEYIPVPTEVVEKKQVKTLPTTYDHTRPVGEAVVKTQNVGQGPYEVRDVVIHDEPPAPTNQEQTTTTTSVEQHSETKK